MRQHKVLTNSNFLLKWQSDKLKIDMKYLIYRWMIASYFNFVVILSFITAYECKQFIFYAIYLTNWNVFLNGCSSLISALLVSFKNIFTLSDPHNEMNNVKNGILKIFWVMTTLSTVISISLCCIYWPFIYVGR